MRLSALVRLVAGGAVALVALAVSPAVAAAAEGPFVVYLDAAGVDSNDGLSPGGAVRSLARAQAVLTALAPQTDVEVRIKQGTYVTGTTNWSFYIPGHTVSFMPVDYQAGDGADDIAGRPLFRSDGSAGYWFAARLPAGNPGGNTNLRFYYLQVERYSSGGLMVSAGTQTNSLGVTLPLTAGANHNTVFGMVFQNLGSKYNSASSAYGGIDLINSSDNLIQNNHFLHNENTASTAGQVHGVYLAHWSKRNTVTANRFYYITGEPMRTRNDSNDNNIYGNTFERTGSTSFYSEWFCDTSCVADNPGHGRECASHGNVFHDNTTISGYTGGHLSWWALQPAGNTYAGGAGCDNEGQQRIRTYGNT